MSSALARDAAPGAPLKRKIAAILAADVAGYSRLVAADEERTLHDLAAARRLFDGHVAGAEGRIFNTAGDSVMCAFDSAVEAVRTAIDIQDSLRAFNAPFEPTRRLEFRIGITIGDVVERDGDLLGDGVNIAARLESLAPAGGICVSRSVHEAVANKVGVEFRDLGARTLKNIPQPIHAFLVAAPESVLTVAPQPLLEREPAGRVPGSPSGRSRALLAGAALVLILGSGGSALYAYRTLPVSVASNPGTSGEPGSSAASAPMRSESREPGQPAGEPAPQSARAAAGKATVSAKPPSRPAERAAAAGDPAALFAALSRDAILPNARTLPELYHNARLYEANGDRAAALKAYATLVPLAGSVVDPWLRYAALLKAGKGTEARATLADAARLARSDAGGLAVAMESEAAGRAARLEAFADAHPDYPPAQYAYAEALIGAPSQPPTLTERRLAFDGFDRFLEAEAGGRLAPLFLDRTMLGAWLDTARKRRREIESFFAATSVRPSASFSRTDSGWVARITLPEPATEMTVRIGERGETRSVARSVDSKTGQEGSSSVVELPAETGRTTLYVGYLDRSGRQAGPFPIAFDPSAARAVAERTTLERYPDTWVAFRPDLPGILSYAQLVANRCGLAGAQIGFGDAPPTEKLTLPSCDATPDAAAARSLLTLPDGTDDVQVQLIYADGTESPVRSFHRP